jgi:Fe-S cluster assembly protein SufD
VNQVTTQDRLALSAESIERRAQDRGEPKWLVEQRLAAWQQAEALEVPTTKQEGWRRTDLGGLKLERLLERDGSNGASAQRISDDGALGDLAGRLRLLDGVETGRQLDPALERQGVLLMSLERAVRERPELVERYLGQSATTVDSKFVALSAALWENGVFVYVPRGVGVELPIVGETAMASGAACFFRTVVIVEEGGELTYVDHHRSAEDVGEALASGIVEIYAGLTARVRYANLQEWSGGVWHFDRIKAVTGRDSRVDWLLVATGGRLHRSELDGAIAGQGSEMEFTGLLFGDGRQHFDHQALQDHIGNDTRSRLEFKAALADRSSSNFTGMIRVNKEALRTDSNLESRNLLLSDHSKADADPRLEILNSDVVRCGHGATVGPLDPEMIYYIQSRGIPGDEARRLVVEAFFEPVLAKIPVPSIRTSVWQSIQRKLGRVVGQDGRLEGGDAWQSG